MSLFNFVNQYDEAWKAIIQPGRQEYNTYDLGPTDFIVKNMKVKRTDFRLLNKRGHIIECSFFQHAEIEDPMPCVIYLHANGCCRLEALQYSDLVLASNISLFCFDFSGCGKSDGLYSTVGWFEQDDLECIIQYVFNTGRVSKVAIWGRSMGAITTILYAGKDPRISCIILDSPFANFKQLIKEVAKKKALIPEFLSVGAFNMIRKTILKKAEFDIDALRPIKYVDKIKMPALIGHAKDDNFVLPQHSKDIYTAYGGPKELMIFEGDHNSERPVNWLLLVKKFLTSYLIEAKSPPPEVRTKIPEGLSDLNKKSNADMKENLKPKQLQKSSKKVPLAQLNDIQKDMKFTWLEHSASSPQLLTTADVFRNEKLHNQTIADIVNNENNSNQAGQMKLRLMEHKPSLSNIQNKAVNTTIQGYPSAQSTYTIEPTQKAVNKTKMNEYRRHSTFNIYPQETAKTHRQLLRGNSDYTDIHSTSLLSQFQEPPSTIPGAQAHNPNKFAQADTKQNKSKFENMHPNITQPPQPQVKKVEIFMKDKGGSCPTNLTSQHSVPEVPSKQTYTIESNGSHTARLIKGISVPGTTTTPSTATVTADNSMYLSQAKSQSGGTSSFGHPSQMPSFSEHVRGPLQEKNFNENDTSSLNRNMSMKSFTSGAENADTSRRDLSPGMHKRRPVLFQMNLNSKVPFINPNQTSALINMDFLVHSENNINFRTDRRMSDNPANILKALVNGAGQDRAALGYRGSGESKGSYLGNKMASK